MGIVAWIVLGGLAGWIANMVMGGKGSLVNNIVTGVIGAFIGGFVMSFFGGQGVTGLNIGSILVAVIGAVILIWLARALQK